MVQAFQLIRGGRDTELQVTSLQTALKRLPELGLLPQAVVDELLPDYAFLRDVEHALQALEDRQTQICPPMMRTASASLSPWGTRIGPGLSPS